MERFIRPVCSGAIYGSDPLMNSGASSVWRSRGSLDATPKPLLLKKGSYSHPDLDLRFMSMDALLFPEYGGLQHLVNIAAVQPPR